LFINSSSFAVKTPAQSALIFKSCAGAIIP